MKLRFLSLMIILSLLVGCQNESDVKVSQGNCSILASIESAVDESRTAVDDAGNVTWIKTDAIGVFGSVTKNAKFTSTADGASVTFEGSLSVEGEEIACVYYPYDETASLQADQLTFTLPAEYTYTGASCAPMLGVKNENDGYKFKHLCGLMRVSIIGVPVGTSTFTLVSEGDNAPSIAGTAVVNDIHATDATLELNGNLSHQITVTITSDEMTNATLYLPLPVGTYSKLSVTFKDETTEYFKKSTSNVTINRGTLLDMPIVATVKKYLDEINNHVATLDLESYDYEGFKSYLNTWLGQQEFVADCSNISYENYEEIEFTTQGGIKGSIILTKSEEEVESAETRSAVPFGRSDKKEAFDLGISKEIFLSGQDLFTNTHVKAYTFTDLRGFDFQESDFDKAIRLSPINLYKTKLNDYKNAVSELLTQNYNSVVLMTGTHGLKQGVYGGCFLIHFDGNFEYIKKNHSEKFALWYHIDGDKSFIEVLMDMITKGANIYMAIKPRFFYDNNIFKHNPLVYGSYCYSARTWQGYSLFNLESNFLGYNGDALKYSNAGDIYNFFYNLFNGVTVENAYKKAHSVSENEFFFYNSKIPNQRYFSVLSWISWVDGCNALVHGYISGWDKLQGRLSYNGGYYKSDVLTYKIYHSAKPFNSPLDEGVISQTVGFGQVNNENIVVGHYMPLQSPYTNTLHTQCLIKSTDIVGHKCYYTAGFEYTDADGNTKIYYGNIDSYVTNGGRSRSVVSEDPIFVDIDVESLKCVDLESVK